MKFPHFFIDRPIFAAVLSVIIVLIGGAAYFTLPVAQYPEIVPPTVSVRASYPGASAEVVADTVAAPIEQEINGVDNMLYMSSQETGDGQYNLTVTFKLGTDLNAAQVLVQNRISVAQARLPDEVQRIGLTVRKNSPDLLEVVHFISPDNSLDQDYVSNYVTLQVRDQLSRLDGVGDVRVFGASEYAMRIWLDPERAAARDLTAGEIVNALRNQNVQVAAGSIGAPPFDRRGAAFELNVQTLGRLTQPSQFEDVVIKTDAQGRVTRLGDVARVELGAEDYTSRAYLNDSSAAAVVIFQRPGTNALATSQAVAKTLEGVRKTLPPGLTFKIVYNPTEFVAESISEVERTLFIAVLLVVVVILVFLQSWRAAIIPVVAIPVALIGTMAVLAALGFSLNTLSLFGLVLAIGIVVDDAIVVVENVERNLEAGLSPKAAAHKSMDEVGGALVAIALVLVAVFIPTALISGISGQFYRQFAITIASATAISCFVSLTLSPALAALLLRPKQPDKPASRWMRPFRAFGGGFNRGFDWTGKRYAGLTARVVRLPLLMLILYAGLIGLAGWRLAATPGGFIPAQDQGYYISLVQLPAGASLTRSDAAVKHVAKVLRQAPGVANAIVFTGLDGSTFSFAPNVATIFVTTKPFDKRNTKALSGDAILADLRKRVAQVDEANVLLIPPPPVRGIGTGGGYKLIVEDHAGRGYGALETVSNAVVAAANATPGLTTVFTQFNTKTPRIFADIDREKADMLGVPPEQVFDALQTYLGSSFINEFNILGRTYRVTAQADAPFRESITAIADLKTRSVSGGMVPIGSVANFRNETGPYRVVRYNLYPAAEIQGDKNRGSFVERGAGTRWRRSPSGNCPPAFRPNGRSSPSSRRRRAIPPASPSAWRWCSSSCCWRRSTRA